MSSQSAVNSRQSTALRSNGSCLFYPASIFTFVLKSPFPDAKTVTGAKAVDLRLPTGYWRLFLLTFAPMQIQDDLQARWWKLEEKLMARFGKKPDMEGILFLIGVQEHGALKEKYTKEQKQDLMHIAVCTLLSASGFYELEGVDEDGWPHFRQLKEVPPMPLKEQEDFIKDHVLLYFQNNHFLD